MGVSLGAEIIILGATGDLARRRLMPALARLASAGGLGPDTRVIGVGRTPYSAEAYRGLVANQLRSAGLADTEIRALAGVASYETLQGLDEPAMRELGNRLDRLDCGSRGSRDRVFYLALPVGIAATAVSGIGQAGLHRGMGRTRLVVEKPFGHDMRSAREFNTTIREYFREEDVFRIDHYLGKEAVQNLLVFRLANGLIQSAWNRERVDSVQITVAESIGIEGRGKSYDGVGALRDMVQSHLLQLLAIVAMDPPARFDAASVRREKLEVLRAVAPVDPGDVSRGQYGAGDVNGLACLPYTSEPDVDARSTTETFVALRLFVDSWWWQGVPFYLRAGKRMARRSTSIAIRFRAAPIGLFDELDVPRGSGNVLVIVLQPDEEFELHVEIKIPGEPLQLRRVPLHFRYRDVFQNLPDGYQTLIQDVLVGDQTLFVHADEIEESWRILTPAIDAPRPPEIYRSGTWGPQSADALAIPEHDLWQR